MIVIATKDEIALANKYNINNEEIIMTGVGGLNVIEALKNIPTDTPILNIGYVGSNNFKIGTVVKINKTVLYHPNVTYDEKIYSLKDGDTMCYTSNDFVLSTDIKENVVFDMELAYIMALGFKSVRSIKIVSDNLSYDEYESNI